MFYVLNFIIFSSAYRSTHIYQQRRRADFIWLPKAWAECVWICPLVIITWSPLLPLGCRTLLNYRMVL